MTSLERITREKGDKRASESGKVGRLVAEEVARRRLSFRKQVLEDEELRKELTRICEIPSLNQ